MFTFQQGFLLYGLFLTSLKSLKLQTVTTMTVDLKPWGLLSISLALTRRILSHWHLLTLHDVPSLWGRVWDAKRIKYGDPGTGIPNVGSQSLLMRKNENQGKERIHLLSALSSLPTKPASESIACISQPASSETLTHQMVACFFQHLHVITEGGMLKHLCEGWPANHLSPLSQGCSTGLWDGDKEILSLAPIYLES